MHHPSRDIHQRVKNAGGGRRGQGWCLDGESSPWAQ